MHFYYICAALLAVTGISIVHVIFLGENGIGYRQEHKISRD